MFNTVLQAEPAYIFKILRLSLLGRFPQANSFLKDGAGPVMVGALAEAADWLTQRFGGLEPERYHWRDVNSAGFAHVLGGRYNPAPTPVDGSVGTVNVSSSTMFDGSGKIKERFNVGSGSLYRMVIVNGQVLHEGDQAAPGLVLERIEPGRTVWAFRGYRYALPSH